MNRKISFALLSAVIIITLGMSSCRSSRHATTPVAQGSTTAVTPGAAVEAGAPAQVAQKQAKVKPDKKAGALIESYADWQDVSMSVKCRLRKPKNLTVSGKATMVRGEAIQISMRLFGFEVAGLYMDRDSIYVYEKLNHTMAVESTRRLTQISGLTLTNVQDLLLGRLCYPGRDNLKSGDIKNFKVSEADGIISLTTRNSAVDWTFDIADNDSPTLLDASASMAERASASCTYSAAVDTKVGPICPSANIDATAGKLALDATVEWSLASATWNSGRVNMNGAPRGYRRITIQQLVQLLGSL